MTSIPVRPVQIPPNPPPRRGRTPLVVGGVVLVCTAATAAAVAFGISVAGSLREETSSETFPGVRELVVRVDEGRVRLTSATGPHVEVRTTRTFGPGYQPVVESGLADGVLTLTSDCASFNLGCEVEQEIAVPAGTAVSVRTIAGGIDAVGLDVPSFDADTTEGAVTAGFAGPPDDVRVRTVAGAVRVDVPDAAYRVSAGTSIGPVDVDLPSDPAAAREITVRTVAGPIDITSR
jgi:hypothetical protein